MKLTDQEKAMLEGREGAAKQKAMELLVRYGEALGAERLVDTNNVASTVMYGDPISRQLAEKGGFDAVFSEMNLDSQEVVPIPQVEVHTCQLIQGVDRDNWQIHGVDPQLSAFNAQNEAFSGALGVQMLSTCTPYQVGNIPVKGEHCAWMESSAVVYINSVLGARTNCEGRESTGAAMLTGKIPYWGYHIPENRLGTHLVHVEIEVETMEDWGLLGYYVGQVVVDRVPVIEGIGKVPDHNMLKHFGAAASSSGGIEMYHIPGVTAEANSLEEAFGYRKPEVTIIYGRKEREEAYRWLNHSARDDHVDFVMLGCPHASLEQLRTICRLLEGKRLHHNTALWVFTPRALRQVADRSGYTKIITDAGGHVMSDTCPAIARVLPPGTKVVATDSAKQAHYLPAITGVQTWFGSLEDCINAALTGKWQPRKYK
jgi:hypothetical protein